MTPIIDKIRKIRAKAQNAGCTEAEALALSAKVEKLLTEHNLTMADIGEKAQYEKLDCDLKYADPWRRSIVFAAARYYSCEALNNETYKDGRFHKSFLLIGQQHCTVVALEMIVYLTDTVVRLSRQHSSVRKEQLSFQRGCGERLASRLIEMRVRRDRELKKSAQRGRGSALIVLGELEQVKQHMEDTIPMGKMRTGRSKIDDEHAFAGIEAAEHVSLSDQIGGA